MNAGDAAAPAVWPRRFIALAGGVVIVAIVGFAADQIARGYRATRDNAWRELDAQALVVAEQTARSVQAVDVVLRHLAAEHEAGRLMSRTPDALHRYLKDQAVGLVQVDSVEVMSAAGLVLAQSRRPPPATPLDVSAQPGFAAVQRDLAPGLQIHDVRTTIDSGKLVFPLSRVLLTPDGRFDGAVAALGRVDYFEDFYRKVFTEPGVRVSLLNGNTSLLARRPATADAPLGTRYPVVLAMAAAASQGQPTRRMTSPVDGADRLGATRPVPDYPLIVLVARDASAVFARWRSEALGEALRTLALASLATLLLVATMRQLKRLDAARTSLATSQGRYALAAAGANVGIWDWDLVHGIGYESQRARQLQGLALAPETQPLADLQRLDTYVPDDAERRRAAMQQHLDGATLEFDGEYRVHAGSALCWVHVRGLCVRDAAGRPLRIAGSVSDVDARKRAEEALRSSEERYQLAVDGSNEGLWDWDLVQDTVYMSPRAQHFVYGRVYRETTLPRQVWAERAALHPDDVEPVQLAIVQHLRGRSPHVVCEFRLRHGSAPGWHWCRQRGIALRDAAGRVFRMAGSLEDVTERRSADDERAQLERQLLQAQKLEAIGTLAGGIAHDFNNILSAILGYGELAQREAAVATPLRRHVDAALAAGTRAKSLVERILAFSRSGLGERMPVHVQSVVAEALDVVATTLPAGVELQSRLAAGDAGILGDPMQLHQVVMNLCANAVQAMRDGGLLSVAIDVRDVPSPLALATRTLPAGRYLRVAVGDTGSGIELHLLDRIFDPFFTTKDVGVGTGLGLSLVHGIVADLDGGIAVDSTPGTGTVFTVYLPTRNDVAMPTPGHLPPQARGNGQTVLLVDDEETLVLLGEDKLAELGYEPVGYTSAAAALAALRAAPDRFDAVLSDEAMPEITGCEIATAARALRPSLPVLLMSGYVSMALLERARDAGVVEVLAKPVDNADLARALAAAMQGAGPAPRPL